jgi:hypothetical protein
MIPLIFSGKEVKAEREAEEKKAAARKIAVPSSITPNDLYSEILRLLQTTSASLSSPPSSQPSAPSSAVLEVKSEATGEITLLEALRARLEHAQRSASFPPATLPPLTPNLHLPALGACIPLVQQTGRKRFHSFFFLVGTFTITQFPRWHIFSLRFLRPRRSSSSP